MELPRFLLADSSALPDDIFVIHTEYPRFILNLSDDDIEWFDDIEKEKEEELVKEIEYLVKEANNFYEDEMAKYEEAED